MFWPIASYNWKQLKDLETADSVPVWPLNDRTERPHVVPPFIPPFFSQIFFFNLPSICSYNYVFKIGGKYKHRPN